MKDMLYEARGKLAEKAIIISRPRPSKDQERARHLKPCFTWIYRTTTERLGYSNGNIFTTILNIYKANVHFYTNQRLKIFTYMCS